MNVRLPLAAFLAILTVPAYAETDKGKCIFAAAEVIPRIPGLTIDESATRSLPENLASKWPANSDLPLIVDINVTAAGQKGKYSYLCFIHAGRANVSRVVE
jgi:hypothetical protein